MKTAKVIIGGAFGDEGKGLFTDYLASQSDDKTCVVRFNGGAQAGHTVETPDGKRHVFSHFGSGSFAGLPTFLSRFFVCSPITFLREYNELLASGVTPHVYADVACPVTTPYDIMINQIVERARGNRRHGSVGVGFGETLERQMHKEYALCLGDLKSADILRDRLQAIRQHWVYARLKGLGVEEVGNEWRERFNSDNLCERFIDDCRDFVSTISITSAAHLRSWDNYIFEGAQGLLLDQDRGWFPHVTRSNTGIRNVLALADEMGMHDLDVYYLTRCYTTRHGAGPLPNELSRLPYDGIVDKTNQPNPYQGTLRFAWLDADLFRKTVLCDLKDGERRFTFRPHVAMSCLDQIKSEAKYIEDGVLRSASAEALLDLTCRNIGADKALASYGPTRATIETVNKRPALRRSRSGIGNGLLQAFDIGKNDIAAVEA